MTNNNTTDATDPGADFTGLDAEHDVQEVAGEIVDEPEGRDPDEDGTEPAAALVIREVIERQLEVGRTLGEELIVAVTDATAAVVETPAELVTAVREGATLPAAINQAGERLQDNLAAAGGRIRSAVGDYVGHQAALPNAVITGAAGIAGSAVRAQGVVAGSSVHGVMTVATEAARAGDIRSTFGQEWKEATAAAKSARGDLADALSAARQGIRDAVPESALTS